MTETKTVHEKIERLSSAPEYEKVTYTDRPPISIIPIENEERILWAEKEISVRASKMPLQILIRDIIGSDNVRVWIDGEVDKNLAVSLFRKGSKKKLLEAIENSTGYSIKITSDSVEVWKYESETFVIKLPSGVLNAQQGSQGQASQVGGQGGSSTRVEGQFVSVNYESVNTFDDVLRAIHGILKKDTDGENSGEELEGSANVVSSLSAITVRTTPTRMKQVRALIDSVQAQLSKQAIFSLRVLEFRSNLGHEQGIDWTLVKDVGQGAMKFYLPGTNTIVDSIDQGVVFEGSGKWDGTSALIKALEKQGSVSTTTPITMAILNNQPNRISQVLKKPHTAEVKTEANENVVSSSITRGVEYEGVDMMITPLVMDTEVALRVSGKLTKIADERQEVVNNVKVTYMDTRESDLSFSNKLRYGQTILLGSVQQSSTTTEKTANFGSSAIGGKGVRRDVVETLVLLTVRRAD
ncbi:MULTISPECIES: hypothetical protein [Shewanella]|nr:MULTISPECIES: hypothetical protein [Shewanella]NJI86958.1 hypothetical protein [Shewanella sp. Iso12]